MKGIRLVLARIKLAINVLDHHDRAVNDDSEINRANAEQVRGFAGRVQEDEGEQQRQRNGQGCYDGGARAHQKKDEYDQNKDHAAQKIPFNRIGGHPDEVAAVVVGPDFYIGWQNAIVEFDSLLLNPFQYILRLFSSAHQDDAFNGIVRFHETKFAEARRMADHNVADVLNAHGSAIGASYHDFANILN